MLDFLTKIGINLPILIGIIGVSEYFKSLDKENKFKKFYVIIPLLLSIGIAFLITTPFSIQEIIKTAFIYFGISTLSYNAIKNMASINITNIANKITGKENKDGSKS